ncbi:MAG: phage portal protein [Bacilli bacterium]
MEKFKQDILSGEIEIDLKNADHITFIKEVYNIYSASAKIYNKMYEYYKGKTDAIQNYKFVTERSNLKINLNYMKKFIKEEVSYSVGKELAYESVEGNNQFIKDINYTMAHWKSNHNSDLMKYLLMFSEVYELYYIDRNKNFSSKIIKPTEGFALKDEFDNVIVFLHCYKLKMSDKEFIDVYTKEFIYHLNDKFEVIGTPIKNVFNEVPVSCGQLSYEKEYDTIYNDIKGLQDAFETNLSDIANEISDFRNAFLVFCNADIDEEIATKMKEKGIILLPGDKSKAEWLIKNINDSFIQNTMNTYEDKIYQLACHINANEKMQSNTSSLALRARLNSMENKCSLNQNSHKDIIKNRIRFICMFLKIKPGTEYDPKDVTPKYTPNIPQDDLMMAQILAQIPEGTISKETGRSQLSFVANTIVEGERVEKELKNELNKHPDLSSEHDGELDV